MSDLTDALKAWWTNARDGLTPKQRSEIRRAARLVADGKVIPVEDIDYEAAGVALGFELNHTFASIHPLKAGPNTMRMARMVVDAALHLPTEEEA